MGYADIGSTIEAIRQTVSPDITKPWTDEDMVLTVRQALEVERHWSARRSVWKLSRWSRTKLCVS